MIHEKCNDNEMFIGNTSDINRRLEELSSIKSLRVGKTAYDIHGEKLDNNMYKSLFINKNDSIKYDIIMMRK